MHPLRKPADHAAWILALAPLLAGAAGEHAGGHEHAEPSLGQAGKAAEVTRTIQVEALDSMRFNPDSFAVRQGETIRFVVRNTGKLKHEFVLGSHKELQAHYEAMKKSPGMEHADASMLSLAPGQSGALTWKFSKTGTVHVACLQPGHYDAGMKAEVIVSARKPAQSSN